MGTLAFVDSDSLHRALREWSADARIEDARAARQNRRWTENATIDELQFESIAQILFQRSAPTGLRMAGGRRINGLIEEVGFDFIRVKSNRGSTHYIRITALTSLDVEGSLRNFNYTAASTTPLISLNEQRSFATAVAELAEESQDIRMATRDADELRTYSLVGVGMDCIIAEQSSQSSNTKTIFLKLDHVSEVVVD